MTETTTQKTLTIQDRDITTKERIILEAPEKKQKVILTITKRRYFDPVKNKVITDQVVHKARYSLAKNVKKKGD